MAESDLRIFLSKLNAVRKNALRICQGEIHMPMSALEISALSSAAKNVGLVATHESIRYLAEYCNLRTLCGQQLYAESHYADLNRA